MSWLSWLWGLVTGPFQAPPAVAEAAAAGQAAPPVPANRRRVLLIVLHVLLVVLVVLGLWYLNGAFGLDRVVRWRWLGLHKVWLPLLFLLLYATFWLGCWLWRLLGPERSAGEFPDVEGAWAAAVAELRQAGIEPADAPLFLVLGRPASSLEQFFAASRQPFQVRHAPRTADAPLHVYANREGIFVTCEGASLLGAQVARLGDRAPEEGPRPTPLTSLLDGPGGMDVAPLAGEGGLEEGPARIVPTVMLLGEEPTPQPRQRRPSLLRNDAEVALQTARLRHLCKLIARDRQPYCPVNGVLVLLPLEATATPHDALETGATCRHDLATVREAARTDCPRFAVLCDGERLPGLSDLIAHFPEGKQRAWVLGQHFPLVPDLPPGELPAMIEGGVAWLTDNLLPAVIVKLMQTEDAALSARLFRLLCESRERLRLLAKLLEQAVLSGGRDEPPLLGGCYLAATGADGAREQGFLAGVFQRALAHQNFVAWTDEALEEDAAYHRWALVGSVGLAVFLAAVIALAVGW